MVVISDGNSEHVAHAYKEYPICDCSRSNQMTDIPLYVRTYFLVTI